jgi:hypothetical protein
MEDPGPGPSGVGPVGLAHGAVRVRFESVELEGPLDAAMELALRLRVVLRQLEEQQLTRLEVGTALDGEQRAIDADLELRGADVQAAHVASGALMLTVACLYA